jgi:hypothetical protein
VLELVVRLRESAWVHKVTLKPAPAYLIIRSETLNKDGGLVDRNEAWNYQDVRGQMVAQDGKQTHYMKGNRIGFSVEFHVDSFKTHPSEIPDDLFSFKFPEDATIFDADRQLTLRNTAASQKEWDAIVRLAGPARSLWKTWLLWLSTGGLIAVTCVALLFWRNRSARQLH